MPKSKVTDIGHAVLDLIEEYNIVRDLEWVHDPVAFALYHTWKKYDAGERREDEAD